MNIITGYNLLVNYVISVLEAMDKKGKDEDFVPWAMGWISSATGIGAGATP